jgi:hypothetical protein
MYNSYKNHDTAHCFCHNAWKFFAILIVRKFWDSWIVQSKVSGEFVITKDGIYANVRPDRKPTVASIPRIYSIFYYFKPLRREIKVVTPKDV